MSRRGAILEGYKVPDLTPNIDPLEGAKLAAEERMHNATLQQQQAQHGKANQNDAFKYIEDNYKSNEDKTNSNIIQQKADEQMKSIHNDAFEYLKKNPNATQFEIAQLFGDRAFNTNQLYVKGRAFKENSDKASLEAAKADAGINANELSVAAQEQAFLDPQTGKVRDDLSNVDPNDFGRYMDEAVKNKPLKIYNTQGLQNHVYNKDAIKTDELTTYTKDRHGGVHKGRVSITIPQDYELEKDAKGFHVTDDNGIYSVVPKSEELPDGSKVLDQGVFERLPNSSKNRFLAESTNLVKAFNVMNGTNTHTGSVEVNTIARKLAYEDMAKMWNNGGVKRLVGNVQPPAPEITINNGSGKGSGDEQPIDVHTPIKEMFADPNRKEIKTDEGKYIKIVPAYGLNDVQLGVILPKAKMLGGEDTNVKNTYIRETEDGKLILYKAANDQKVSIKNDIRLGELTKTGANTAANKDYGVKVKNQAKREGDLNGQGNKTEQPKQGKVHKAKMADGTIITSTDGVTWFDSKGKKIQ